MKENNQALVTRMIDGDEAAFDELYRSYSEKLYRMAYFITGNRSDSEDILQETFVKCYLHRKALKQPECFDSWICQILVRTSWRFEKRRKGKRELSFDGILEDEEQTKTAERLLWSKEEEPVEKILQAEQAEALWKLVSDLDTKYRTVVVLYYYNEFSTREIARITGTLEGTVKSRLFKARTLLRKLLETERQESSQNGTREVGRIRQIGKRGVCHEQRG